MLKFSMWTLVEKIVIVTMYEPKCSPHEAKTCERRRVAVELRNGRGIKKN